MKNIVRLIALLTFFTTLQEFGFATITLSEIQTNVTCYGGDNGSISVTPIGGSLPYFYAWNDGNANQNRTNLVAGIYDVTITDNTGATAALNVTITESPGFIVSVVATPEHCSGQSTGTITVSVNGVTPGYTYLWNDGIITQNRVNLTAAVYYVTITDSMQCSAIDSGNVTQPIPLVIQLNAIPLTCFGSNNGAINTNVSGGASPFSYNWSGGMYSRNIANLVSSNYMVTVTDLAGCRATASAFVPEPLQLTATAISSPLSCSGGPTGSVNTTVNGGTPGYTYWWGSGVMSQDRININSGNYSVTVTDGNGCTVNATANILAYTPLALSTTQVNNVCFGGRMGSIDPTVVNGSSPYSFMWSTGTGTQNASALASGTFSVTVMDGHACTASINANITEPPFSTIVNSNIADPQCAGESNGSISLNISNANPPFTYIWGGGATTQTITNLVAGIYMVTVIDNSGCIVTSSFNVSQPTTIIITSTQTNVTCFAGNDGSIYLNITGSFAPYYYHWNDSAVIQNRTNVSTGNYMVTVTDNHSCTATSNMVIMQPARLTVSPAVVNISCNGVNNGSINITTTGGTGPYTYYWTGGINTQNRTNLATGTYMVTVTDNSNCSVSSTSLLSQPTGIGVALIPANVSCNGGTNGGIITNITGGTPPYTYNWGAGVTVQNRANIGAGTYTVRVTDFSGCTGTDSTVVTEPTILTVASMSNNVTCNGGNNGGINLTIIGGTIPYTVNWGGGVNIQNRTSLIAGNYAVAVTDIAGCSATSISVINQPASLNITTLKTDVFCNDGNTGMINITVTGGTTPYSFNWGGGITSENRTNLAAGNYILTVTDNSGCMAIDTTIIIQPTLLVITSSQTDVSCNGGNNGAINITVTGSTGPYTYYWDGGITTQSRTNIVPGNYTLLVTDALSCTETSSFSVSQPAAIFLTLAAVNVRCSGEPTGQVNLSVVGGTGRYTYVWSTGSSSQNLNMVAAGGYSITITDAYLCTAAASATISEPLPINVAVASVQNNTCVNSTNGSAYILVTGGAGLYAYLWSNGSTNQNIAGVGAGNYLVTVTDANLCNVTAGMVIVTLPDLVPVVATTNVTCFAGNNGAIGLTVTGGAPPYVYHWTNNAVSAAISNLVASQYSVVISDANNCTAIATASVTEPAQIQISQSVSAVQCFGLNNGLIGVNVTGGTPLYTYNWSNNATTQNISGITAGVYQLTITDAALCTATTANIRVIQPTQIAVVSTILPAGCAGQNNGAIQLSVSGGNPPYNFSWSNNMRSQHLTGLSSGSYMITVTDQNGCIARQSDSIGSVLPIEIAGHIRNASCQGANNGAISLSENDRPSGYSYSWNMTSPLDLEHLAAGLYAVTVSNAAGCSAQFSFDVAIEYQLEIQAGPSTDINSGQMALLSVSTNVDHGNVYIWTPSNSLSCSNCNLTEASPLQTTNYTVSAIDSNGCKASAEVMVEVIPANNIFIPNAFTPNNDGQNDEFQIFGDIKTINNLQMSVFDRWGEKVFESSDLAFKWDGSLKGEPVAQGVYVYMMQIAFMDGSKKDFNGSLTLLR